MTESNAELLFPPRIIVSLRSLRGPTWQGLVERIINRGPLEIERLAFILMMVYFNGCIACQADSFKAMRGCHQCSILSIKRFRGDDRELSKKYIESINEIKKHLREETNG